ncbi:hypothetical protein JTB14_032562 [Gonioctena quinquepunctata]|nr:hypothetical protein JTB14_032562 [Gonioctena quinquepunctata]
MKSIPTDALLAEGAESPLGVRRTWICTKYASRALQDTGNKITTMLINLYEKYHEDPPYWRNKAPLGMIEGFDLGLQYQNQLDTENGLSCFRADLTLNKTTMDKFTYHQRRHWQ